MKTNLILACLLLLPLLAAAQEKTAKTPYELGKWYVGVRQEIYWFSADSRLFNQTDRIPPSAGGTGINVWLGHRLTRHLDVQAGAFFNFRNNNAGVAAINSRRVNDTLVFQENRFVRPRPFYLPVVAKFAPFGTHRRVKPYLLAGMSMAVGRVQKTTLEYDPARRVSNPNDPAYNTPLIYSRISEKEGFKALFGAYLGIGLEVRVINRVSLSLDGALGRNLTRDGSVVANGGIGLLYDFAPKAAK